VAGWAVGAASCYLDHPHDNGKLLVGVRCRFGSLGVDDIVLLDTAGEWSVVGADVAELVGVDLLTPGRSISLHSRYGTYEGGLHRMPIALVADDGSDLIVDATALVIQDWPGPPVLGFRGFLERVRVALDPGCSSEDAWFYFGEPSVTVGPCRDLLG